LRYECRYFDLRAIASQFNVIWNGGTGGKRGRLPEVIGHVDSTIRVCDSTIRGRVKTTGYFSNLKIAAK